MPALARQLSVSETLVEQMLAELTRLGYLRLLETCSHEACTGCPQTHQLQHPAPGANLGSRQGNQQNRDSAGARATANTQFYKVAGLPLRFRGCD